MAARCSARPSIRSARRTSASFLLQAQSSKAQVIGLANAGGDTINAVKQASEFGIQQSGQKLVALPDADPGRARHGLEGRAGPEADGSVSTGMRTTIPALSAKRLAARPGMNGKMPSSNHAGVYAATMAYLNAVAAKGSDNAKDVGAADEDVLGQDKLFGDITIRQDGRVVHPLCSLRGEEARGVRVPLGLLQADLDCSGRSGLQAAGGGRLLAGEISATANRTSAWLRQTGAGALCGIDRAGHARRGDCNHLPNQPVLRSSSEDRSPMHPRLARTLRMFAVILVSGMIGGVLYVTSRLGTSRGRHPDRPVIRAADQRGHRRLLRCLPPPGRCVSGSPACPSPASLLIRSVIYAAVILPIQYFELGTRLVGVDARTRSGATSSRRSFSAAAFSIAMNLAIAVVNIIGPRFVLSISPPAVYHSPIEEERFVLFVDIAGSTGLAEKMGGLAIHRFLDQTFRVLTDPVVDYRGEILALRRR